MVTRTEYTNIFKNWSGAEIKNMNGRLLKTVNSQEEANAFLKNHFHGDNFSPCDVKIEFDGCTGYVFKQE